MKICAGKFQRRETFWFRKPPNSSYPMSMHRTFRIFSYIASQMNVETNTSYRRINSLLNYLGATGSMIFLLKAQILSHSMEMTEREPPCARMNCLRPSTVRPRRITPRTVGRRGSSLQTRKLQKIGKTHYLSWVNIFLTTKMDVLHSFALLKTSSWKTLAFFFFFKTFFSNYMKFPKYKKNEQTNHPSTCPSSTNQVSFLLLITVFVMFSLQIYTILPKYSKEF